MLTKTEYDAARIYELETQNAKLRAELDELRLNYDRVRAAFEKQTIEKVELRNHLEAARKVAGAAWRILILTARTLIPTGRRGSRLRMP
jgi:hypothetical protein